MVRVHSLLRKRLKVVFVKRRRLINIMASVSLLVICMDYKFHLFLLKVSGRQIHRIWNRHVVGLPKELRECLIAESSTWNGLTELELTEPVIEAVNVCFEVSRLKSRLNLTFLENVDEKKGIVLPNAPFNKTSQCLGVTLGIGGDVKAETALLELFPNCQLHGADPAIKFGTIFETVGTFYPFAVAAKTENRAPVFFRTKKGYWPRNMSSVGLVDFLQTKVKITRRSSPIDFLWVDAEGAEHQILPMFARGAEIEQHGIVVCQMNIEIHIGAGYSKRFPLSTMLATTLQLLIHNSNYLPIHAEHPVAMIFLRTFFINVANEACLSKYFAPT